MRRAAVALVLRPDDACGLDLLFIKRADYEGDPWSGQIAFPGGRHEPSDADLLDTAVRETREEIGVDLGAVGVAIGTLDELWPRAPGLPPIVVRPYVFALEPDVPFALSYEVAAAFWAPLAGLRAPGATFEATVVVRGEEAARPGRAPRRLHDWGMTERIFRNLLAVAELGGS